jgi:hypothetical protein
LKSEARFDSFFTWMCNKFEHGFYKGWHLSDSESYTTAIRSN